MKVNKPNQIKVAAVQHSNSGNIEHNVEKTISGIRAAAKDGAQLVVLQELHRSLYFCQVEDTDNFDLAEPIPGASTDLYSELANELKLNNERMTG